LSGANRRHCRIRPEFDFRTLEERPPKTSFLGSHPSALPVLHHKHIAEVLVECDREVPAAGEYVSTHAVSHCWHHTVDRADSPRKPCSGGQRHTETGVAPSTSALGYRSPLPCLSSAVAELPLWPDPLRVSRSSNVLASCARVRDAAARVTALAAAAPGWMIATHLQYKLRRSIDRPCGAACDADSG
jgi:hypothetical protein